MGWLICVRFNINYSVVDFCFFFSLVLVIGLSGAPSVSVRLHPNRESVRRGDNLEVRCDVTGDPSALVSWRRVGGQLSRNAQVLGNLLRYCS